MSQFSNSGYNDALVPSEQADVIAQRRFISKVFAWMTVGLSVTGIVALLVSGNKAANQFVNGSPLTGIILLVLMFGLIFAIRGAVAKLPAITATLLFLLFSAVMGAALSSIFLVYTRTSIFEVFFISAATFGSSAAYGYITQRDLTSLGHLCGMALWGIIIAMLVNFFMQNSALQYLISVIGVLVFVGLTAYDTQKIKYMYMAGPDGSQANEKASIIGALTLYLDFINIFLFLLQMLGQQRD